MDTRPAFSLASGVRDHPVSRPQDRAGPRLRHRATPVSRFDAFLVAVGAADLTPAVFDRWCQTQAHLKSGIRRTQMRMVRNLCLYRRRTEPDCFVPDPAFFPPCHQYAPPYLLTEDEMARLIATASTLFTTPAYPLRAQAIRIGLVLLYTAGLRRGELVRLTVGDYDPQAHTLLVRASKFHKSRLLPLSADAARHWRRISRRDGRLRPEATTDDAPLIWRGGAVARGYSGSGFGPSLSHPGATSGHPHGRWRAAAGA